MSHPQHPNHSNPKASGASIWSLILGILSITCLWLLGSIPAIILGIGGMKKADADPENVGGRGMALAGIITGSIGILAGLVPLGVIAAFALPAATGIQGRAYQAKEINNMRQTLLAIRTYAFEYEGAFPEKLMDLKEKGYIDTDSVLYSAEPQGAQGEMFLYRAGFNDSSDIREPILLSPKTYRDGSRVVGFVDGRVTRYKADELAGIVEKFE